MSIGEKVEGTAILFAHAAKDGCIECGASVSGHNCPGIGFATGNDSVGQTYDRIVQSTHQDEFGNVQVVVHLSGEVIPNGSTGKPIIRASVLRGVKADPRNGS